METSTIIMTLKWLAVGICLMIGCKVVDHITYFDDYSGQRTISFEYKDADGDLLFVGDEANQGRQPEYFSQILEAMGLIENFSNIEIDTKDERQASISYDFDGEELSLMDEPKFDQVVGQLPDEVRWFFEEMPNRLVEVEEGEVTWQKFPSSILEKDEALAGIQIETQLDFKQKIKEVSDASLKLLNESKSLKSIVWTDSLMTGASPMEVHISFEKN